MPYEPPQELSEVEQKIAGIQQSMHDRNETWQGNFNRYFMIASVSLLEELPGGKVFAALGKESIHDRYKTLDKLDCRAIEALKDEKFSLLDRHLMQRVVQYQSELKDKTFHSVLDIEKASGIVDHFAKISEEFTRKGEIKIAQLYQLYAVNFLHEMCVEKVISFDKIIAAQKHAHEIDIQQIRGELTTFGESLLQISEQQKEAFVQLRVAIDNQFYRTLLDRTEQYAQLYKDPKVIELKDEVTRLSREGANPVQLNIAAANLEKALRSSDRRQKEFSDNMQLFDGLIDGLSLAVSLSGDSKMARNISIIGHNAVNIARSIHTVFTTASTAAMLGGVVGIACGAMSIIDALTGSNTNEQALISENLYRLSKQVESMHQQMSRQFQNVKQCLQIINTNIIRNFASLHGHVSREIYSLTTFVAANFHHIDTQLHDLSEQITYGFRKLQEDIAQNSRLMEYRTRMLAEQSNIDGLLERSLNAHPESSSIDDYYVPLLTAAANTSCNPLLAGDAQNTSLRNLYLRFIAPEYNIRVLVAIARESDPQIPYSESIANPSIWSRTTRSFVKYVDGSLDKFSERTRQAVLTHLVMDTGKIRVVGRETRNFIQSIRTSTTLFKELLKRYRDTLSTVMREVNHVIAMEQQEFESGVVRTVENRRLLLSKELPTAFSDIPFTDIYHNNRTIHTAFACLDSMGEQAQAKKAHIQETHQLIVAPQKRENSILIVLKLEKEKKHHHSHYERMVMGIENFTGVRGQIYRPGDVSAEGRKYRTYFDAHMHFQSQHLSHYKYDVVVHRGTVNVNLPMLILIYPESGDPLPICRIPTEKLMEWSNLSNLYKAELLSLGKITFKYLLTGDQQKAGQLAINIYLDGMQVHSKKICDIDSRMHRIYSQAELAYYLLAGGKFVPTTSQDTIECHNTLFPGAEIEQPSLLSRLSNADMKLDEAMNRQLEEMVSVKMRALQMQTRNKVMGSVENIGTPISRVLENLEEIVLLIKSFSSLALINHSAVDYITSRLNSTSLLNVYLSEGVERVNAIVEETHNQLMELVCVNAECFKDQVHPELDGSLQMLEEFFNFHSNVNHTGAAAQRSLQSGNAFFEQRTHVPQGEIADNTTTCSIG